MGLVFKDLEMQGFERVVQVTDDSCGLKAIIAIHDSKLGPGLGGIRFYPYQQLSDALFDVTRLAKGMTHKSAMAEVGFGGAKSVVMVSPQDKTPELLKALGRAVEQFQGAYICAPDYGCTMEDIDVIRSQTKYVVGGRYDHGSGDPGPFTAWGTLVGMKATLAKLFGSDSGKNRTVAIQGLGSVGFRIAEHLFWLGAKLVVADPCQEKTDLARTRFNAQVVSIEDILKTECDLLAPCALGGILNPTTIPALRCKAVVGCANNQLLTEMDAKLLKDRDILYAPDFVVNAGGLINVSFEVEEKGYNSRLAKEKIDQIYDTLLKIYDAADEYDCSTQAAVTSMIEYRLTHSIGKREAAVYWHHANLQEEAVYSR
jgi:leucine dehydrogenase